MSRSREMGNIEGCIYLVLLLATVLSDGPRSVGCGIVLASLFIAEAIRDCWAADASSETR